LENWVVMLATMILFPAVAGAQVQTGATLPPLLIPLEPPEALPASGTEGGYFFNLRPLGADFGQTLADHGVYLVARNLSQELGMVSGGEKRGWSFEGFTQLGVNLDMARIAGIPGGVVHFLLDDLQGQPNYAYSGSAYFNNRTWAGDGPALRVQEFFYEQNLLDDRLKLRLGLLSAYTQFDGSELYCTFMTTLCRTAAGYTFDRGYPPYLASSWGAIAQIRISGPFYTNIGIYEDEPTAVTTNHGDFPGPDWGLNYANGATIPVQFGYRTTIENDPYPRAFSVGGLYNTGSYADPLLNIDSRNRILYGGTARTDVGASLFYLQAQQMVYRPDSSDRGLTVFGGTDWATSGQPDVERMFFVGTYYKGIFAQRPNDTLSIAIAHVDVNPRIAERVNSLLAESGGGRVIGSEMSYEVNYGFAIAPGMSFKPFAEYVTNPDQADATKPSATVKHALFVGALFEVDFVHLFGLPTMGR